MEPIIFTVFWAAVGIAILYFVVREAVKAGIKDAYGDLNVYLRNLVTNAINEANQPEQNMEAAEQQEQKDEKKA
ncbi:hypothetical protein [uncultured Neglectibacter sp.]|uniref:hypothetical protein n=1 Tax=uncultured Neglectibacter sp. TaxID=1924108 RepID=UPI0034DF7E10